MAAWSPPLAVPAVPRNCAGFRNAAFGHGCLERTSRGDRLEPAGFGNESEHPAWTGGRRMRVGAFSHGTARRIFRPANADGLCCCAHAGGGRRLAAAPDI